MSAVLETWDEARDAEREPLLVLAPLRDYLDRAGIGSGGLAAAPVGDGHSNVTYVLERDDLRVVLRRPPRRPYPPSAHDVVREGRLVDALARAGARVPGVRAICEDEAVIGAPFVVMEWIDGAIVAEALPEALDRPEQRARIGAEAVDALAELHGVELERLAPLRGRSGADYLERQLRRFDEIWRAVQTREVPALERVSAWLRAQLPRSPRPTLVHGDFRLGNVMFARGAEAALVAVLDWELATVGDPLADVGYLSATWARPGDAENVMRELSRATRLPGFLERDELRERYARLTHRAVDGLRWYEVLALWKSAIFLESSYRRYRSGSTDDAYFARLGAGVPDLAQQAWEWACAAN